MDVMLNRPVSLLLALLVCGGAFAAMYASRSPALSEQAAAPELKDQLAPAPIPEFATWPEIRMKDLFKNPIGDYGLEYSDAAKALDGKSVRITGFMAQTDWKEDHHFLLATFPLILHDREYGQADEIPAGAVLVEMPKGEAAAYTKGLMMLSGTLRLGRFQAPGDRTLWASLELHPDAKHWQPSPSLLTHLSEPERRQLTGLVQKQSNCSCRQCAQARPARRSS